MKLALFTQLSVNLPQTYPWEGRQIETRAGIVFCQPFALDRQASVRKIIIACWTTEDLSKAGYDQAWEADIVAVIRSAPPYDTVASSSRFDIFHANARRLETPPVRKVGAGFIRYID